MLRHSLVILSFVLSSVFSFAQSGPDPAAILKDLYQAHDAEKGPFADKQNRALLEQYFTKELAELLVKDAIAADGEVGALEFDPLYESQDPQIANFKIGAVQADKPEAGLALVEVTFKDSGQGRRIVFRFQQDAKKAWKIADINYSDGSTIAGLLRGTEEGDGSKGGHPASPEQE